MVDHNLPLTFDDLIALVFFVILNCLIIRFLVKSIAYCRPPYPAKVFNVNRKKKSEKNDCIYV
ncbi:unnamed protein product [Schistosoma margrebowiei]|uniref:Uncharacterized protein n=1 Tax=Schistosoma margrebowiei TaxID=48269 RepID=A0A183M7G2_9TREM|nr:unnamed protein product [Schistosoma margrebowiei]